jgi:hypothetical protein
MKLHQNHKDKGAAQPFERRKQEDHTPTEMAGKATSSKYKYLNGVAAQPTECIGGINAGAVSPDSNVIKSNTKFIAVPWKVINAYINGYYVRLL